MIQETITRIKLTASEGMMLTNGTDYGRVIFLANTANAEDYYEITEEEYTRRMEEEQKRLEEEANSRHEQA